MQPLANKADAKYSFDILQDVCLSNGGLACAFLYSWKFILLNCFC